MAKNKEKRGRGRPPKTKKKSKRDSSFETEDAGITPNTLEQDCDSLDDNVDADSDLEVAKKPSRHRSRTREKESIRTTQTISEKASQPQRKHRHVMEDSDDVEKSEPKKMLEIE